MESRLEQAAACLPISLRQRLEQLGGEQKRCEEIRLVSRCRLRWAGWNERFRAAG